MNNKVLVLVVCLLSLNCLISMCDAYNCAKGQYWSSWNMCTVCLPGYCCPGDDRYYSCTYGSYANQNGQLTCYYCSPGTFANQMAATSCTPCQPGTYAPNLGATQCAPCPTGTFNDQSKSLNCTQCASGTSSKDHTYCISKDTPPNALELDLNKDVTIPPDGAFYYLAVRRRDYESNNNSLILSFKTSSEVMIFGSKETARPSPTNYMFHSVGKNPSIFDQKRGNVETEVYYFVIYPATSNTQLVPSVFGFVTASFNIGASSRIVAVKCWYKENLVLFTVNKEAIPNGRKIRIKFTLDSLSSATYQLLYSSNEVYVTPMNYETAIDGTETVYLDVDRPNNGPLGFSFYSNTISWTVGFNIDIVGFN